MCFTIIQVGSRHVRTPHHHTPYLAAYARPQCRPQPTDETTKPDQEAKSELVWTIVYKGVPSVDYYGNKTDPLKPPHAQIAGPTV